MDRLALPPRWQKYGRMAAFALLCAFMLLWAVTLVIQVRTASNAAFRETDRRCAEAIKAAKGNPSPTLAFFCK